MCTNYCIKLFSKMRNAEFRKHLRCWLTAFILNRIHNYYGLFPGKRKTEKGENILWHCHFKLGKYLGLCPSPAGRRPPLPSSSPPVKLLTMIISHTHTHITKKVGEILSSNIYSTVQNSFLLCTHTVWTLIWETIVGNRIRTTV